MDNFQIEVFHFPPSHKEWPQKPHRVLRALSTYPKNIRTVKYGFFGAKPHGEQHLLKVFCPLWENPANIFEKKPFGLLNKVLEGR